MATYGPGIDQSQHAKSVSHIIKYNTIQYNNISSPQRAFQNQFTIIYGIKFKNLRFGEKCMYSI